MSSDSSLWYRVGYALEQARQLPSAGRRTLAGLKERAPIPIGGGDDSDEGDDGGGGGLPLEGMVGTGVAALAARTLHRWVPGKRAGLSTVLWAGAAGATAALLVDLARPLLRRDARRPDLGSHTPEHLLAGASQGLVYGAVVEPLLPGPALLKGALFGSAEYVLAPGKGLTGLLGGYTPLGRVPFVLKLLDGLDAGDRDWLEHVGYGVALAVLYGSSPSSSGMRDDDR